MSSRVTISTIAREAGVSKTTVSRYINGNYDFMSEATRSRIGDIIKKYDYIPNNVARSLKSKRSGLIGIIVHKINHNVASQTVSGMQEVCEKNGYATIVCCSNDDPQTEDAAIRMCLNQQVDGIIISPCRDDQGCYQEIYDRGIPIVLCLRRVSGWEHASVYVQHDMLIDTMMVHLRDQGFDKVRFIMDATTFHKQRMRDVFVNRAQEFFGMEAQESVVVAGKSPAAVKAALDDYLGEYPGQRKAVMAINTNTLFLTLDYLAERGVRIPDELGVCGYDALGWSKLAAPGISAIQQPMYRMGVAAGEELMRSIKEGTSCEQEMALDGEVFFRASTVLKQAEKAGS